MLTGAYEYSGTKRAERGKYDHGSDILSGKAWIVSRIIPPAV